MVSRVIDAVCLAIVTAPAPHLLHREGQSTPALQPHQPRLSTPTRICVLRFEHCSLRELCNRIATVAVPCRAAASRVRTCATARDAITDKTKMCRSDASIPANLDIMRPSY